MKSILTLGCLVLLLTPLTGAARYYRWVNPESGRVHLSGKPPAWYRTDGTAPRVQVFENGKLIDDTAHPVAGEERQVLRDRALEAAAQAEAAAQEPASETGTQKTNAPEFLQSLLGEGNRRGNAATTGEDAERAPLDDAAAVERLKAIIADWEQRQTEGARSLINAQDAPPQPAGDPP